MAGRLGKKDKKNIVMLAITAPVWLPIVGVITLVSKIKDKLKD